MKSIRYAVLFVTAAMSIGAASQAAQAQGKSRTDVVDELKVAQHEGAVPAGKTQYPPSTDMVKRNKDLHGMTVHPRESDPKVDAHDKLGSR
ncbi:DUF4148 domain-containing protein [Burkholderia sp. AU45388]|uniref:DUF4148 domain-containing protein n=1 Tax=Burkholderia sp. AU45388 TaxID=3059206 RepID=UPI0026534901|nr:DUF4148 domain-containing protein [Burkholderia sp. AU45388]MDN7429209.1 DUF4148 domain-containing protein [Burkholderia sp. AU45388]